VDITTPDAVVDKRAGQAFSDAALTVTGTGSGTGTQANVSS
jgi:hypothetical protein